VAPKGVAIVVERPRHVGLGSAFAGEDALRPVRLGVEASTIAVRQFRATRASKAFSVIMVFPFRCRGARLREPDHRLADRFPALRNMENRCWRIEEGRVGSRDSRTPTRSALGARMG
jgi:hypothetical protein